MQPGSPQREGEDELGDEQRLDHGQLPGVQRERPEHEPARQRAPSRQPHRAPEQGKDERKDRHAGTS
jgi:hypothetical protein